MEQLSPMLQQYQAMKKQIGEKTLLFFRLGDFYELFFEDAQIVSKELDLILTARAAGNQQKAPMCGVPHHAANAYMQRLVDKGYKIAVAEQMEDPATSKGLVKRDIIKIVTQGTNLEADVESDHYLVAISQDLLSYYLCFYNITNNQLFHKVIEHDFSLLLSTLKSYQAKEILCEKGELYQQLAELYAVSETNSDEKEHDLLKATQHMIEQYLSYTQKKTIHPTIIELEQDILQLDGNTIANLELINPLRASSKSPTLYNYLNKCETSMGKRLLKKWISQPLFSKTAILARQQQVGWLKESLFLRDQVRQQLKMVYDVERIATKITFGQVMAQDILRLKESLKAYQQLQIITQNSPLTNLYQSTCNELITLIEQTISDQAPILLKDGNTICHGVSQELDRMRDVLEKANQWLLQYEQQQKTQTGIKNLKVGFSRAFGYFIEVSKGQINLVKEEFGYMPRQTLTNGQRYLTTALKQHEDEIQVAQSRSLQLEEALFNKFVKTLQKQVALFQQVGQSLANTDCLLSLAEISSQQGFITPTFNDQHVIELLDNRHPILVANSPLNQVISNDWVSQSDDVVILLTGPNMGGKSTYMRQCAISVIMAQIGCDVMAAKANLPLFDKIFTRMGASDDILSNQSTFMVEMVEANTALSFATKDSLILFDEIGRGTSTYDGMAIAHGMIEYIASELGCKTIFSTHYHELTQLQQQHRGVKNYQVAVHEDRNKITFQYKVIPGAANRSYGIHVAQLAKLPTQVVKQAMQVYQQYQNRQPQNTQVSEPVQWVRQPSKVEVALKSIDVNQITPIEALNYLVQLKQLEDQDE